VQLPAPPQDETPRPLAFPEVEPTKLSELPSEDELLYPTTDRSQALDFTKLKLPTVDVPKPLPGIAGRPATSTTTR